ncbi:MAG: mechanosensitive ion channel family protein [Thermodesulfobacteriota bacterium]|nr:mechanosensitive ion channel family protein [Thermodesulfobacteriota bacterium]
MEQLIAWLNTIEIDFFNAEIQRYIIAASIMLVFLMFKRLFCRLLTRVISPMVKRSTNTFDDLLLQSLRKPFELLVIICGMFIALQVLQLPTKPIDFHQFSHALIKTMFTFNIAWVLFNAVAILERTITRWAHHTGSPLDEHLLPFIRKIARSFIVVLALLLVIQNLGYSISGLLASLGIGGLAVALAAKDTLSNIFGSIMILLDRPFRVGDWVKTGDMEGVVEEIGFRSTRIRTFSKTLITVPNNILATTALNNFSRMPKRRIKMTIGVTYDSTPQQMRDAVNRIRTMLEQHPTINQEFMLVNFTNFSASSLDILVYCFTATTNWERYLAAREDVCLKIMDIITELGMEMAFPSQSLYLHNEDQCQEILPHETGANMPHQKKQVAL